MLTKMVNGIQVACSAAEEAAIRAEWLIPQPVPVKVAALTDIIAVLSPTQQAAIVAAVAMK